MATQGRTAINGVATRHIACKPCRDRKVRCGGEQPTCDKCRRAGEQCVYLPTQKPTKADLAQTVEALQKRLVTGGIADEAEAYIRSTQDKATLSSTSLTSPSSSECIWPANQDSHAFIPSSGHTPPGVHSGGGIGVASHSHHRPGLLYQQQSLESPGSGPQEQSQAINHQQTLLRQCGAAPFSMDGDIEMNIDPSNLEIYLQDGFEPQRGIDEETGAAVLHSVTNFLSASFRNQAEASVMASVVADYIAWLCKAPPGGGIPAAAESPVYLGILKTLENRLRELCDVSESRSNSALRELVSALETIAPPGGAMATRLGNLEEDLQRESRERAEVFRSRYNPCALLSEQSRNTLS